MDVGLLWHGFALRPGCCRPSTPFSWPFFSRARSCGSSSFRFCDDKLPGGAVGNIVLRAKILGQAIAFDTMACFPGIFRVVDAGMNDAAVARAGGHAEFGNLFDKEDVLPAAGKRFGDGTADYAAANDQNVDLVHKPLEYDQKNCWEVNLLRGRPHQRTFCSVRGELRCRHARRIWRSWILRSRFFQSEALPYSPSLFRA